jgi:prepilin-type N-terminal cleavage/methylation domain-containing protein
MKKFKAFTLIETLIVIIVFCIGILVVLQWLSQTLRNKDYANTQIKSAFFAREWIELLFNLRDANYHKELPWNCIFKYSENGITINLDNNWKETSNSACDGYLWSGEANILKIWIWSGNEYVHIEKANLHGDFDQNLSWFQIYFHTGTKLNGETWFRYDYTWTEDEKTWFARYLLITWVVDNGSVLLKDKILKVESHVLYQRWAITWEKVMETFFGNYEFNQDVLF